MKSEIFKDLLSENEIKQAMKSIYDPWSSKDKLEQNVIDTITGLQDLLNAVKNAQFAVNDDPQFHILESIKKKHDMIAYLLEKFTNEFKPLYEETSSKYIAAKLTHDDQQAREISSDAYMDHSLGTIKNSGWSKN